MYVFHTSSINSSKHDTRNMIQLETWSWLTKSSRPELQVLKIDACGVHNTFTLIILSCNERRVQFIQNRICAYSSWLGLYSVRWWICHNPAVPISVLQDILNWKGSDDDVVDRLRPRTVPAGYPWTDTCPWTDTWYIQIHDTCTSDASDASDH